MSAYDCSLHQVAAELANLPVGWATADATTAGCHRKDTSCSRRPLSTQDEKDAKRRWWLPHATHSVWLASHQLRRRGSTEGGVGGAAADCAAAAPAGQPRHDTQLVLWTQLTPPTAASVDAAGSQSGGGGAGGGASTLPFLPFPTVPTAPPSLPPIPTPTLAALPREAVGRLCGARMQVDPSWLRRAPPMDCAVLGGAIGSFFGQAVLHMQFTHADTRRAILEALHWWKAPTAATSVATSVASSSSAAASTIATSSAFTSASASSASSAAAPLLRPTSCAALASGSAVVVNPGMLAGVVLSSALAPSALICLLPGHQPNQPLSLLQPSAAEPNQCPCCWRVDALQQAAARGADSGGAALASSPQAAAAESKALRKAARYSGCRIWRRYA